MQLLKIKHIVYLLMKVKIYYFEHTSDCNELCQKWLWFLGLYSIHMALRCTLKNTNKHIHQQLSIQKVNIIACYLSIEVQIWAFNRFLSYVERGSKEHFRAYTTEYVSFLHSYFIMRKKVLLPSPALVPSLKFSSSPPHPTKEHRLLTRILRIWITLNLWRSDSIFLLYSESHLSTLTFSPLKGES